MVRAICRNINWHFVSTVSRFLKLIRKLMYPVNSCVLVLFLTTNNKNFHSTYFYE